MSLNLPPGYLDNLIKMLFKRLNEGEDLNAILEDSDDTRNS